MTCWNFATSIMADVSDDGNLIVGRSSYSNDNDAVIWDPIHGMRLLADDFVFPYYRDDAMLLAMGLSPYDLMLQLFARKELYSQSPPRDLQNTPGEEVHFR